MKFLELTFENIVYLESYGNYVKVHRNDMTCDMIRASMKSVEDLYSDTSIMRIHKKYMVNMDYVESVTGNTQKRSVVVRPHNVSLKVSRKYANYVKKEYERRKEEGVVLVKNDPGYPF